MFKNNIFKFSKAAEDGFSKYRDLIPNVHHMHFSASGMRIAGTSFEEAINGWAVISMPDGTDSNALFSGIWPDDMTDSEVALTIYWIPKGAGDAYTHVYLRGAAVGEDKDTMIKNPSDLLACSGADIIHQQTYTIQNQGYKPGYAFAFGISRAGGAVSDTLAADLSLVGAMITYR